MSGRINLHRKFRSARKGLGRFSTASRSGSCVLLVISLFKHPGAAVDPLGLPRPFCLSPPFVGSMEPCLFIVGSMRHQYGLKNQTRQNPALLQPLLVPQVSVCVLTASQPGHSGAVSQQPPMPWGSVSRSRLMVVSHREQCSSGRAPGSLRASAA